MKPIKFQPSSKDILLNTYFRDITRYSTLSQEEELKLAKKIKLGDERALKKLVQANLLFVVSVAKNYQNQGMALIDLIDEGNMGLIIAAHRFQDDKNFKFISYAIWWIRQSILLALSSQSRITKIPPSMTSLLYKIKKIKEKLDQKLNRFPTDTELNDALKKELNIKEETINRAYNIYQGSISIDKPIMESDSEDMTLKDILQDNTFIDETEDLLNKKYVEKLLGTLNKQDKEVLQLYFGLTDLKPYTLKEISAKIGLTSERVRQIKIRAIKQLKKISELGALS